MNIKEFLLKLPIKFKIASVVIFILIFSLILFAFFLFQKERDLLIEEMTRRGNIMLQNLVHAGWEAIINENKTITSDVISEFSRNKKKYSVEYCIVLDKNNKVFDHSVTSEIGKIYNDEYSKELKNIQDISIKEIVFNNKEVIDMVSPIYIISKEKKVRIGTARIGISKDVLKEAVKHARNRTIILTLIFIILGIIVSFLFSETLTKPIRKIIDVIKKVSEGDLQQKVEINLKDEIGLLASNFNEMIKHLREKLMMSKYVSKSTIDMISKKEDTKLELGGKRKVVTIFFSDIRGFTAYSETKEPEEVVAMLNKYLSIQAEIVAKNNGYVDKFVGDEVVAVFEDKNMIENSINSAIQIQQKINEINQKEKNQIFVGIGIHIGEVVMGNIGSENRMDYTIIGDNVNLTSRLCSSAEKGKILVSQEIYKKIKNKYKFSDPSKIQVKGKSEPVLVYEIIY